VVSCVARQLVLKRRTAEELECFEDVFGHRPIMAGFYALGEVAPIGQGGRAGFHNETLTAAALAEV
jgi:small ligand-binding sensory domain FIST